MAYETWRFYKILDNNLVENARKKFINVIFFCEISNSNKNNIKFKIIILFCLGYCEARIECALKTHTEIVLLLFNEYEII